MQHFLGTRFNLKVNEWKTAKDGKTVLSAEWLSHRFDLFEKYCFPSVINQKNNNFYWFIFFDIETPRIYQQRIIQLTKKHKNIILKFIDGHKSLLPSFQKSIHDYLDTNEDVIITTRLDNDDSIHCDFIDTIQKLSLNKKDAIIDVRKGYQLQVSKGLYECREYYTSFNPFISIVESSKNFKTVYSKKHRDWQKSNTIISYNQKPLWIEIVHERNKINDTKKHLMLTNSFNLAEFGLKEELKRKSHFSILFNNLKIIIKRIVNRFKA